MQYKRFYAELKDFKNDLPTVQSDYLAKLDSYQRKRMFINTSLFFRLIPRRTPLLIKGAGGVFYYKLFIRTLNYLQYPRVGLKRNFNRKGGGYNGEQPMEGLIISCFALYCDLPGKASSLRGLLRKLVAGRRGFTNCLLRTVSLQTDKLPPWRLKFTLPERVGGGRGGR
jgi:hypothetical protein